MHREQEQCEQHWVLYARGFANSLELQTGTLVQLLTTSRSRVQREKSSANSAGYSVLKFAKLLRAANRHLSAVVGDDGVLSEWDGGGVGLLLLEECRACLADRLCLIRKWGALK